MDTATLEAHALTLALTNHPNHTVTKRWMQSGVAREWGTASCSGGATC